MPFGRNRPVEPRAGRVAAAGSLVRPLVPSAAAARTARREGPALPLDLGGLSVDRAPHVMHLRSALVPVFDPLHPVVAILAHAVGVNPRRKCSLLGRLIGLDLDVRPPRRRKVLGALIVCPVLPHRAPVGHQPVDVDHRSVVAILLVRAIRRVLGPIQPVLEFLRCGFRAAAATFRWVLPCRSACRVCAATFRWVLPCRRASRV